MPSIQLPGRAVVTLLLLSLFSAPVSAGDSPKKAENVLVVTLDGFRWQELFGGADDVLLDAKSGGVRDVPGLVRRYKRDTAAARRETLMPFLWGTIAKKGQIFGNPARKARAQCTNNMKQLGIGLLNYHDANQTFPPACLGTLPNGVWGGQSAQTLLLPFIEQTSAYNNYIKQLSSGKQGYTCYASLQSPLHP